MQGAGQGCRETGCARLLAPEGGYFTLVSRVCSRVNLKRAEFTQDNGAIDDTCGCAVCAVHSRGYLRHLFQVGEPTASRLVSLHNLAWTIALMSQARSAILAGTFGAFRKQVLDVWA